MGFVSGGQDWPSDESQRKNLRNPNLRWQHGKWCSARKSYCLWFESAINKYMGPITCDANYNTHSLAQLSQQNSEGNRQGQWNFCPGNEASGKNEKHQKTSSKQTSCGDRPKLERSQATNLMKHWLFAIIIMQPNDKLPSLKRSFLQAKQQSAGYKWNLQLATWFMLNNLS